MLPPIPQPSAPQLAVLLLGPLVPALLYAYYVRNLEKHEAERWGPVIASLGLGLLMGLVFLLPLSLLIFGGWQRESDQATHLRDARGVLLLLVLLPVLEEAIKLGCIVVMKREIDEVEDGLIYGVCIGAGFGIAEGWIGGFGILDRGFAMFVALVALRSLSGVFLHANATALAGYGLSRLWVEKRWRYIVPYFLFAVGLHALSNVFAFAQVSVGGVDEGLLSLGRLVLVLALASLTFRYVRRRLHDLIRTLDRETEETRKRSSARAKAEAPTRGGWGRS